MFRYTKYTIVLYTQVIHQRQHFQQPRNGCRTKDSAVNEPRRHKKGSSTPDPEGQCTSFMLMSYFLRMRSESAYTKVVCSLYGIRSRMAFVLVTVCKQLCLFILITLTCLIVTFPHLPTDNATSTCSPHLSIYVLLFVSHLSEMAE